MRKDCKGRYFAVLRFLYEKNTGEFAKLDNYRKGSRVQIARDKDAIEKSGRNTWPQILEDTPYWVLTNLSNYRKRDILDDVLRIFRYPNDVIALVVNSIPDVGNRGNQARLLRKYV
jgi:negative modulator of initiation of replication